MDWYSNLRNFVKQKMDERNLNIKQFSHESHIPLTTVKKLCDGTRRPRLKTIVILADFFECSIDEMLGIIPPLSTQGQKYPKLTLKELISNLAKFIHNLLEDLDISASQLGVKIGCSEDAFRNFLKQDFTQVNEPKGLNSDTLFKLHEYSPLSVDRVLGRTLQVAQEQKFEKIPTSNVIAVDENNNITNKIQPHITLEDKVKNIRTVLKSYIQPETENKNTKSQVESLAERSSNSRRNRGK